MSNKRRVPFLIVINLILFIIVLRVYNLLTYKKMYGYDCLMWTFEILKLNYPNLKS